MRIDELQAALTRMSAEERMSFQKSFGGGPNNFTGRHEDIKYWLDDFARNPQREYLYARALNFPTEQERLFEAQFHVSQAAIDSVKAAQESNEHARESNRIARKANDNASRANRLAAWSLVVAVIAAIIAIAALFIPPFSPIQP